MTITKTPERIEGARRVETLNLNVTPEEAGFIYNVLKQRTPDSDIALDMLCSFRAFEKKMDAEKEIKF